MKVLLTRRIPSSVLARLEAACDVDLFQGESSMTPMPHDELTRRIADKEALISVLADRIDAALLESAPNLKIVATISVGYDNIDVAAAKGRGVIVTNTPNVLTAATAELTWALILSAARRVVEGDRLVRGGRWKGWALDFMLGTELSGKQLGIIGAGRIGRAVAEKAAAFGMTAVFAQKRGLGAEALAKAAQARAAAPSGVHTLPFDELLATSDVISLHVPGGAGTRHMIGRKEFARMKRTAIFVNTARGSVVDEEAIAWALQERLIAAAALDVYQREPHVPEALLAFENVVLAPHLGSATRETRTAMADLAVRNVLAVASGAPPLTPV